MYGSAKYDAPSTFQIYTNGLIMASPRFLFAGDSILQFVPEIEEDQMKILTGGINSEGLHRFLWTPERGFKNLQTRSANPPSWVQSCLMKTTSCRLFWYCLELKILLTYSFTYCAYK